MASDGHIFLSYRSKEMDFAIRLAADLKNAGVNLWMDRLDINPGDDWVTALQNAVNASAAMIAVLSPEYVSARYCRKELARAERLGCQIFPVLLRAVPDKEWPIEIERYQYTDFTRWQDETIYAQRVQDLVATLKRMFSGQITEAPDAETRYLTSLIADLEARQGVLAYVELPAEAHEEASYVRPMPSAGPLLSASSRFTVLEQKPETAAEGAASNEQQKTHLSSIHEAVEKYPRFVLVGPLGAGKTTTLHRLMLEAARKRQADHSVPLPFLVDLSTWNDDRTLVEFIRSAWPFDSDVMPLLVSGNVFLYLDELSQIGSGSAQKIELLRQWLKGIIAPQRVIVTCQAEDYSDEICLDLPTVMTDGLDEQHVRQFVANYVGDEAADRLLARIFPPQDQDGSPDARMAGDLSSLVQNPLALTALTMLYKSYPAGDMPRNMGALFKRLTAELWERERLRRAPGGHSAEVMENAFSRLAFEMVATDQPAYVPRSYALQYLGDEELLWAGQSAMLLETQGSNVRFAHPLVQEYFAAVGLGHEGLMIRLAYPSFNGLGERLPGKWDRIIIGLSGITSQPDRVVENISEVDPFLALECLATGIPVTPYVYQQAINRLWSALRPPSADGTVEEDRRIAAARLLALVGDEKALPLLLDTLRDASWEIRRAAVKILKYVSTPAMPGLLEALMNPEQEMREATSVALRQLGEEAVPVLLKVLQSSEWMARRGAAWALGELRDAAAVSSLVETLHDEDKMVRREAAGALGWIRDEAAIPGLLATLHDPAWQVRKSACEALCWIGEPAVPGLIQALSDGPTEVRRLVVEALGHNDHPMVIPTLMEVSHDQSADVRAAVATALGRTGNSAVVPRLIDALSDTAKPRSSEQRVCDLAAEALELVGTPEAVAALRKWRDVSIAVKGEGKKVQMTPKSTSSPGAPKKSATQAKDRLQKITHNSTDWPARQRAVEQMGESRDPNAVPELIKALADETSQVRVAAVAALARIRTEASIHGLLQALQDEDYVVSEASAEALVKIGSPALPGLLQALRSANLNVRAIAIDALGKIGNPAAFAMLRECLKDTRTPLLSDKRLCDLAADALEKIGGGETLKLVARWRALAGQPSRPPAAKLPATRKSPHWENFAGLLNALHSPDLTIKQEATRALREYAKAFKGKRDAAVTARLCEVLNDAEWLVRSAAADALAWVADPASVPALLGRVGDSNWMVRVAVVRALAEVGDPRAVPEMVKALKDSQKLVREAAADGLGRLGSEAAIPTLLDALSDPETFVRRAAIEALGELRSRESVSALVRALRDGDQQVRWTAAEALGKIGDAKSVPGLVKSLDDQEGTSWETRRVCDVAAEALERIGTPEARAGIEQWRQRRISPDP